jgi:capsular exopolysaccharide synthesis family protein
VPVQAPAEYSLLDYLSIARRRWPWVVVPVVALVAASAAWTVTRPARYQAEATVLLADTAAQRTLDPSSQNTGFLSRELSNEILLAESDEVEALVEAELGLLPRVVITSSADADVLVFRASAAEPALAARYANVWAEQYIGLKRDEAVRDITAAAASLQRRLGELRQERQELRAPIDELEDRIVEATDEVEAGELARRRDRLLEDLRYELDLVAGQAQATLAGLSDLQLQAELASVGEARIAQVAAPPSTSSNPPLSRNLALGAVLGLLAGFGLALLAETRDNTIKSTADVASVTDLPVLASIPPFVGLDNAAGIATYADPEGRFAEGYHKVRSSLEFASLDTAVRTILITSASAAEGKSTTSSNLALAFASVGKRTVLVDVDFRRARQHTIYGVAQSPGLSDVVLYGVDLPSVAYAVSEPGLETLRVVPSGTVPPAPAAFVGTAGFERSISWIRGNADVVVLDTAPLLAVSDPHTMAKSVDAVVVTVLAGQTTKSELLQVITVLGQVGANLVGVVLIGVDEADGYGTYYYTDRKSSGRSADRSAAERQLWQAPDTHSGVIDLTAGAEAPGSPVQH